MNRKITTNQTYSVHVDFRVKGEEDTLRKVSLSKPESNSYFRAISVADHFTALGFNAVVRRNENKYIEVSSTTVYTKGYVYDFEAQELIKKGDS